MNYIINDRRYTSDSTATCRTKAEASVSITHRPVAELASGISDDVINVWYETARKNGHMGGKLLDAVGGGFLYTTN
jgi:galactokinase/mevalonate kinase-like predicted kinase